MTGVREAFELRPSAAITRSRPLRAFAGTRASTRLARALRALTRTSSWVPAPPRNTTATAWSSRRPLMRTMLLGWMARLAPQPFMHLAAPTLGGGVP